MLVAGSPSGQAALNQLCSHTTSWALLLHVGEGSRITEYSSMFPNEQGWKSSQIDSSHSARYYRHPVHLNICKADYILTMTSLNISRYHMDAVCD